MEKTQIPSDLPTAPYPPGPPSYNQSVYPNISDTQPGFSPQAVPTDPPPVGGIHSQQASTAAPLLIQGYAPPPPVGPQSCSVVCPSCHALVQTRVSFDATSKTHIIAVALCLLGGCLCSCLPYFIDSCRSTNHYCPSCGAFIGTYSH